VYQKVIIPSSPSWPGAVPLAPEALAQIQAEFSQAYAALLQQAQSGQLSLPADRRFHGDAWKANPYALLNSHIWQLSGQAFNRMVDVAQIDESLRNRLRFTIMQWLEATAPSNFVLTNPDVQQLMLETGGQSFARGLQNLVEDIGKGRMSQTDDTHFEVGRDLATTPGSVV